MGNVYDDYKEKVKYDFTIRGILPYKLENGSEDQQLEALEDIEKQIELLLSNEDYNKIAFDDVALGRVYPKLEEVEDTINILFGISLYELEDKEKPTLQDLKDDVKEYMKALDSNVDGVSVCGLAGNEDERDDTEPCTVYLKSNGEPSIEVVEEPKEYDVESYIKNLDRKLVNEGSLVFVNNQKRSKVEVKLNDDGIVELYKENKICDTKPFSKLSVIRECKSLVQEGYILDKKTESEIKTGDGTLDTEKEKENIEQASKDVDELQQMKDELINKVNNLMNESKTEDYEMKAVQYAEKYGITDYEVKDNIMIYREQHNEGTNGEPINYTYTVDLDVMKCVDVTSNEKNYVIVLYTSINNSFEPLSFIKVDENNRFKPVYEIEDATTFSKDEGTKAVLDYNEEMKNNETSIAKLLTTEAAQSTMQLKTESTKIEDINVEDINVDNSEFPSTELTQEVLTVNELLNIDYEELLTKEQKDFIIKLCNSLEHFKQLLNEFIDLVGFEGEEELISIDDYICQIQNGGVIEYE